LSCFEVSGLFALIFFEPDPLGLPETKDVQHLRLFKLAGDKSACESGMVVFVDDVSGVGMIILILT
jgi:hypothetical protein